MSNALFDRLERLATWPAVALLFVLFLLCSQGFEMRRKSLGYENPGLDGRFWYSPEEARDFFEAIGDSGRRLYAITEVTLDLVFPLVYGSLFAALLVRVYPRPTATWLVWIPLVTAAMDLLENVTLASLAWRFDGRASPVVYGAAVVTAGKTVLFLVSLLLLLVGGGLGIWRSGRLTLTVHPSSPPP